MPGAGSVVAANYVYAIAKPDGLSLAVLNADQLLTRKGVQFDWSKFAWIGSTTRADSLLYMWGNAPYKSIQDVRNASTPPRVAARARATPDITCPSCSRKPSALNSKSCPAIKAAPTLNWP